MINKFKEHRRDKGLTQAALVEQAKVPRYKVQMAEKGFPALSTSEASALANVFGYQETPTFLKQLTTISTESECV